MARLRRRRITLLGGWSPRAAWPTTCRPGRRNDWRSRCRHRRCCGSTLVTSWQLHGLFGFERCLESNVGDRWLLLQLVGAGRVAMRRIRMATGRRRRHIRLLLGIIDARTAGLTVTTGTRRVGGNTVPHRFATRVGACRTHCIDTCVRTRRPVSGRLRRESACRSTWSAGAWRDHGESRGRTWSRRRASCKHWRAIIHWVGCSRDGTVVRLDNRWPVFERIGCGGRGADWRAPIGGRVYW